MLLIKESYSSQTPNLRLPPPVIHFRDTNYRIGVRTWFQLARNTPDRIKPCEFGIPIIVYSNKPQVLDQRTDEFGPLLRRELITDSPWFGIRDVGQPLRDVAIGLSPRGQRPRTCWPRCRWNLLYGRNPFSKYVNAILNWCRQGSASLRAAPALSSLFPTKWPLGSENEDLEPFTLPPGRRRNVTTLLEPAVASLNTGERLGRIGLCLLGFGFRVEKPR